MSFLKKFFLSKKKEDSQLPKRQNESPLRVHIKEKRVVKVDTSSWFSDSLTVSPNIKRVAYMAQSKGKVFIVLDGKPCKKFNGIVGASITFSPDSKRIAYIAEEGNEQFVVVENEEGKAYDGIAQDSIVFSPDNKKIAFVVQSGNKWSMVINGSEGKAYYDVIANIVFSPDSKRIAYCAQTGGRWSVILDGNEGNNHYDGIMTKGEGKLFFDSENNLQYLGIRGDDIILVTAKIN